jgi:predicted nucleotidyltransferase
VERRSLLAVCPLPGQPTSISEVPGSIPAHPPDQGPHLAAKVDDHTIETIARWAQHEPLVLEIWTFGSRVRGQTKEGGPIRPDSDLDMAIRLEVTPSGDLGELQAVWSKVRNRAKASLSLRLPRRLELLEGGRSPCLESYVRDCSRLIYRR